MVELESLNKYLASITTFLSFFGTLFIIISFYVWKDIQTTSRRILLYISMADFLTSVATIIALSSSWIWGRETEAACTVQSVLGTLSVLASFFWTVSMALYLYITICWKNADLAKKLMPLFHGCGWGIPVIMVSLACALKKLGDNGDKVTSGWCWIKDSLNWKDQVLWMLLAGKLWEIIAYFVIAVLYALIKRSMKKEICQRSTLLTKSTAAKAQTLERKLICIPLIFVMLRIWGTIRFFLLIAHGPNYEHNHSHDWLLILQGIGDNAPGFANFLLFCLFTEKCFGNCRSRIQYCPICFLKKSHGPSSSNVFSDTQHQPLLHSDSELICSSPKPEKYLSI